MSIVVQDSVVSSDSTDKTLTYKQIIIRCLDFCGGENTGIAREKVKRWVNSVIGEIWSDMNPHWMMASTGFETVAEYNTGTATFTKGSKVVTFAGGAAIDTSHVGRKLVKAGDGTGYVIASRDSAIQVTLDDSFMGEDAAGVEFKIVDDSYSLAADFHLPRLVDQLFTNIHLTVVEALPVQFKISRRPQLCRVSLDKKLVLYPAPDRVIKINYEYFRDYSLLTDETAAIHVPDRHVSVICWGVARNFWMANGQERMSNSKADRFSELFEKGKMEIRAEKYHNDAKLVQFIPYRQPGIVNPAGDPQEGWGPSDLVGQ